MTEYYYSNHETSSKIWLFLCAMIYKFALDWAYATFHLGITNWSLSVPADKFMIGVIWCVALFLSIRHTNRCASSFFLYLIYLVQIIPITSVYVMKNEDSVYYFSVCGCFLLCVILVNAVADPEIYIQSRVSSRMMIPVFMALAVLLMVDIVTRNGAPTNIALNFNNVYILRSSGWFQTGKLFSYIMDYSRMVFIPCCITFFILKKRYFYGFVFSVIMLLLYLYSGNKTILFGLFLIILCAFWSRRKNCYFEIFTALSLLLTLLIIGRNFSHQLGQFRYNAYYRIIDRCLFTPAELKFYYYDFFQTHPLLGFYSILPSWLIPVENPYPQTPVPNLIGAIYYHAPLMYANTGFLAEGYSHFGHIGTVLELMILAFIFKQMDYFQKRTSYSLTIGFFVYAVYSLSDGALFTSLGFGSWMLIVLILIFYQNPEGSERFG